MKFDVFLNNFARLTRNSELGFAQKAELAQAVREAAELRGLRRATPRSPRAVKRAAPEVPKQVTSICKVCKLPWPHLTKFAWSRHGYYMVMRRGTLARKRILAGGQPWGEKFRSMGKARMAQKYVQVRVAIFKEEAPRAFLLLGRQAVEELITERKHRLVREPHKLFRALVRHRYGGVRYKQPLPDMERVWAGRREWLKSLARTRPSGVHVK